MKKKRLAALVLVLVMLTALFSGCAKGNTSSNSGAVKTTDDAGATTESKGDPTHIVVTYITLGTTPTGLGEVQDAVNAISVPKINVEVEFRPVAISETAANYPLWISSGEQIDLMMLPFQNVANYTNSGSLEPLGDLVDKFGPDIANLEKEYPLAQGGIVDKEVYGLTPVLPCYGYQGALCMTGNALEGVNFEKKDRYTMDDLTTIFAAVKKAHPDMYPYGIIGSSLNTQTYFQYFGVMDTLGANYDSGVLLDTKSTKIANLFESEEYYNYLKKVQEWFQAGYITPDAATTDSPFPELVQNDIIASLGMNNQPTIYADYASNMAPKGGATLLPITEMYNPSISASNNTYWTIPVTSADPEAAMKFLNLTYADTDLMNLIQWGVEGTNYVKTDTEGIIKFPDGVDSTTSSYYNTLGLWGDRRGQYFWSQESTREKNDAFTQTAMGNPTKALGYAFDNSQYTNQIVAIDSVIQQYVPALETGSVEDLDSTYKEFISALKTAGIEDVIAENQKQFDAWLAKQ